MRDKLFLLDLGRMHMERSSFLGDLSQDDPIANDMVEFPISACLIEGARGRILFDTGCHPNSMASQGRWSAETQNNYPWSGGEVCHLPNRLEQLGLGPNDIDHVVLSHMHFDHAGCIEYFRKSQIIAHRDEFTAALTAHADRNAEDEFAWRDTDHWKNCDLNWRLVERDEKELALSDTVSLLNWGAGHSAGMLGLDVSLPETGHIILASDAIYSGDNYGPPARESGFIRDAGGAARTVDEIRARATRQAAQVWYGHDLKQFESLRSSDVGWYE